MTQFDRFARKYMQLAQHRLWFIRKKNRFFIKIKSDLVARTILAQIGESGKTGKPKILDVGCGNGLCCKFISSFFGRQAAACETHGIDLSPAMLEEARKQSPETKFKTGDGAALPYEDNTFDACFTICVFHHMEHMKIPAILSEMKRVTKKGGLIIAMEHNPLNPLTQLAVSLSPIDKDARLVGHRRLSGFFDHAGIRRHKTRFIIFLPFVNLVTAIFERAFFWLPLGAQYSITGKK